MSRNPLRRFGLLAAVGILTLGTVGLMACEDDDEDTDTGDGITDGLDGDENGGDGGDATPADGGDEGATIDVNGTLYTLIG